MYLINNLIFHPLNLIKCVTITFNTARILCLIGIRLSHKHCARVILEQSSHSQLDMQAQRGSGSTPGMNLLAHMQRTDAPLAAVAVHKRSRSIEHGAPCSTCDAQLPVALAPCVTFDRPASSVIRRTSARWNLTMCQYCFETIMLQQCLL